MDSDADSRNHLRGVDDLARGSSTGTRGGSVTLALQPLAGRADRFAFLDGL